jgi:MscS family membrane protein
MNKKNLTKILLFAVMILHFLSPLEAQDKAAPTKKETPDVKASLINIPIPKKSTSQDMKAETPKQVINISLFTITNVDSKEKEKKKEDEDVSIVKKADFEVASFYDLLVQMKKWWHEVMEWFGNQQTNMLILFSGILLTFVISTIFGWVFRAIIVGIFAKKTTNKLDDQICDSLRRPITLLIFTIGIFLSSIRILHELDDDVFIVVLRCFLALIALSITWGIYRLVEVFTYYLERLSQRSDNNLDDLLVNLINKSIKFTILFIAILFIGQTILGLRITALVAGAGIAGLAIALAAKDTLANFFGSVMIMLDKPFTVGERITVDAVSGSVEKIGFRSTRIRSLTGHVYSIPNSKLADSVVENIAKRPYIKHMFDITLVYDTTPEQMRRAIEILHDILDNHEGFNEEFPPRVYFTDFKDWALNINVILWFQSTNYIEVQQWKNDINLEILKRFNAEGLDFAFPTSTNYLVGDSSRELKITTLEEKNNS